MNKKNIIISLLVFLVVGLGYYSFFNKEQVVQQKENSQTETGSKLEDNFAQNQNCLRYKDGTAKKLEGKDSPFGETSLEQIFYSPKQNSCLYVEYSNEKGFYNKRLLDILNDGYSSTPLEMCSSVYPTQEIRDAYTQMDGNLDNYYKDLKECDSFDEIISHYK